jgi:hypothetical protein
MASPRRGNRRKRRDARRDGRKPFDMSRTV